MKTKLILAFLFLVLLSSCSHNESSKAEKRDIIDAVFASGNIIDKNEYLITAAADGYLDKSLVKEGDTVTVGTAMFLLSSEVQSAQLSTAQANFQDAKSRNNSNSPQVQQLNLQIEQAKSQFANDEINFKRYDNLVKTNAVSQQDYEKAKLQFEASKHNLAIAEQALQDLKNGLALNEKNTAAQLSIQERNKKDYILTADFKGVVMSLLKNQGEYVKKGETLAKIGDGNHLAKLFIAEEDIESVKLNEKVLISLNTNTQKTYTAFISRIYPAFDTKEQSFIAEATFNELPHRTLYNTQLQGNIIIAEKKAVLTIPSKFVLYGDSVLLKDQSKRKIQKGISNNEWTEVIQGLSESETLVLPKNKK